MRHRHAPLIHGFRFSPPTREHCHLVWALGTLALAAFDGLVYAVTACVGVVLRTWTGMALAATVVVLLALLVSTGGG